MLPEMAKLGPFKPCQRMLIVGREIQSTINLFFVEYKPVKLETGSTFSDNSICKVSQCYHTLAWSLPYMVESLFGVVKNILQRRPHD